MTFRRARRPDDARDVDLLRARADRLARVAGRILHAGGPDAIADADAVLAEALDLRNRAAAAIDQWTADLAAVDAAAAQPAVRATPPARARAS